MAPCSAAPTRAVTAPRWGSDVRLVLAAALLAALAAVPAAAADWGAISPATSTMESVRAQYGGPTRTEGQKVEGYDTTSWIYEGAQAPAGMTRMVVDFGLLQAGGFKRDVVRSFRLEPHHGVFTRDTILTGWGRPSGYRKEGRRECVRRARHAPRAARGGPSRREAARAPVRLPPPPLGRREPGARRRVANRAQHPRHVAQRRVLAAPLLERAQRLALEVDDREVATVGDGRRLAQGAVAAVAGLHASGERGEPGRPAHVGAVGQH